MSVKHVYTVKESCVCSLLHIYKSYIERGKKCIVISMTAMAFVAAFALFPFGSRLYGFDSSNRFGSASKCGNMGIRTTSPFLWRRKHNIKLIVSTSDRKEER